MIEESAEAIADAQSRGQKLSEWVLLSNLEFFEKLPDVMKEKRTKLEDELYPGANLSNDMRHLVCECYMNLHGGTRAYRSPPSGGSGSSLYPTNPCSDILG